jgi:3',5'-cyclic AMP phosphodiesterase CpdA
VLAEILADCPIAPEKITLVPGNHDAYTSGDAWARALAGSLRRYAPTSAPGSIVRLRNAIILPLSTSVHQHWTRSAGRIDALDFRRIRACAIDCPDDCPIVLGQHHPPYAHALAAYQWIDGLQNHAHIAAALGRLPRVHVLHGHTHRASDRRLGNAAGIRAFAADAVVDNEAPLRLYELANGSILPLTRSTSPGGALSGSSRGG